MRIANCGFPVSGGASQFRISAFRISQFFSILFSFFVVIGASTQGGSISGERLGDRKLETITDREGAYDFAGLVAGEYTLAVEFSGFKKYEQKISVQIEATVDHDVMLQPVPLSESVTVTDDRTEISRTESTTLRSLPRHRYVMRR